MSLKFVYASPKLIPLSEQFEFYKTLMNWQKMFKFNANCVFAQLGDGKCTVQNNE